MVGGGVIEDALAVEICEHVGDQKDGVRRVAIHGFEHPIEVVGCAHAERLNRYPNRARGSGGRVVTHAHAEVVPVPQHCDSLQLRDHLFDERKTLGPEMPVMLPPGRAELSIRCVATGSPPPKATTVGRFATLHASMTGKPTATITSTWPAFIPRTISGSLPTSPAAPRASNVRFLPSV